MCNIDLDLKDEVVANLFEASKPFLGSQFLENTISICECLIASAPDNVGVRLVEHKRKHHVVTQVQVVVHTLVAMLLECARYLRDYSIFRNANARQALYNPR